MSFQPDIKHWQPRGISKGKPLFTCLVCQDGLERKAADCKAHESTQGHIQRLRLKSPSPEDVRGNPTPSTSTSQAPTNRALTEDALRALLVSATSQRDQPLYPPGHPNLNVYGDPNFLTSHSRSDSPATGAILDWGLYEFENTIADPTPQDQLLDDISQATLAFLNEDISDFEVDDPSDSDNDAELGGMRAIASHGKTRTRWLPSPYQV
ncbi:hypothetical protein BDZ97DRAFT_2079129 [Flammula alnicola]|nr:hypothetical protein BDZ97DRAFT_2079129 [Flammula alnicola]